VNNMPGLLRTVMPAIGRALHAWVLKLLPALLLALLAACSGTGSRPPADDAVMVAAGVEMQLLAAGSVISNALITQRIDASYRQPQGAVDSRSFIVQIEAGADDMRMVGLTPMGVQIFALSQHGTALAADVPAYVSLPFDPRYMLADMQLSLADITAVNARLAGATLHVAADGSHRELVTSDGRRVMRIDYRGALCDEGAQIRVIHHERHYEIAITTVSCERS
jgi:hypothetical protein